MGVFVSEDMLLLLGICLGKEKNLRFKYAQQTGRREGVAFIDCQRGLGKV
jgi:hypothetical protein